MPRKKVKECDTDSETFHFNPILRAIMTLSEPELTRTILIPLVEEVHPGRVEYTHSSDEAGRDIISFGRDAIGRQHILCVQVKARAVSHGARSFGGVFNVATSARHQGVTMQDGTSCVPNEVWYVTSHPFAEPKRRQVSEIITKLDSKNIKFISGEELALLITEKLPDIASALVAQSQPHLVTFLTALSKHTEGRAFGLSFDRHIEEFYVTAAVSCTTPQAQAALQGDVHLAVIRDIKKVPILRLVHFDELRYSDEELLKLLKARIPLHASRPPLGSIEPVLTTDFSDIIAEALQHIDSARESLGINLSEVHPDGASASRSGRRRRSGGELEESRRAKLRSNTAKDSAAVQDELSRVLLSVEFTFDANTGFKTLVDRTKDFVRRAPAALTHGAAELRDAIQGIRQLDDAVRAAAEMKLVVQLASSDTRLDRLSEVLRVKVPKPEHLLELFKVLIVEGPPGCGKTTLLRTLAIRLANLGQRVAYLSCAEFGIENRNSSLLDLVRRFGRSPHGTKQTPETILVIDALDESAFDISTHVEEAQNSFANIILSCRTAYVTKLRSLFPQIALSPFTDDERSEFFKKWFGKKPDYERRATELVAEYPDLNHHTRLPLIATILVSLIENGIEPRTRADIYSMRLDLLLSRWDKSRGVKRFAIDKPEPKRRFLRQLAYRIHSSPKRARLIGRQDLQQIYEDSLGKWGYDQNFDDILNDLVLGSGILIEERRDVFSFGHLTFQEHLAGEHLAYCATASEAANKFGNDWWREPLNFYSCIKGDITEFVDRLLFQREFAGPSQQLSEMLRYAPYSSPGIVDAFGNVSTEDIIFD